MITQFFNDDPFVEYSDTGDDQLFDYCYNTVFNSNSREISRRSLGGFGYHGKTPIGESWGVIRDYAPNIAEVLEESNWAVIVGSFDQDESLAEEWTIERFNSWATPTENLMVRLIGDNGLPTNAAMLAFDWHSRLADYPIADENHYSQLESDYEYTANLESIDSAIHNVWLVSTDKIQAALTWNEFQNTYNKLNVVIWDWIQNNDPEVWEHCSYGYSGHGGYLQDDTPIIAALYAMGLIDREAYDDLDWEELESTLESYVWNGIQNAFRGYRSKLDR